LEINQGYIGIHCNVPIQSARASLRLVVQIYCPALHVCRRRCRNVTAISYVTNNTWFEVVESADMFVYLQSV